MTRRKPHSLPVLARWARRKAKKNKASPPNRAKSSNGDLDVNEYSVFSYSITRDGLVRFVLGCVEVLGALEQNWKGALYLCSFRNFACFLLSSLLTCVQQVSGNQFWGFWTEQIRRIKAAFKSNKCSVNEIILCHRLQELASWAATQWKSFPYWKTLPRWPGSNVGVSSSCEPTRKTCKKFKLKRSGVGLNQKMNKTAGWRRDLAYVGYIGNLLRISWRFLAFPVMN